jgi:hypothetical protein
MKVIHPRYASIDVSKRDAKVCVRIQGAKPRIQRHAKTPRTEAA